MRLKTIVEVQGVIWIVTRCIDEDNKIDVAIHVGDPLHEDAHCMSCCGVISLVCTFNQELAR